MNNRKIEHVCQEQLPEYGLLTCSEWHHWLHPLNGPLPDQVHIMSCVGEQFRVAIWELPEFVVTATEILDRPRTKEELELASKLRGWILDTRRWEPTPEGLRNSDLTIPPPLGQEHPDWEELFFISIARGAVALAVTTNMGNYQIGNADKWATT